MARASKQAVVYIIDTSPSMRQPYPSSSSSSSSSVDVSISTTSNHDKSQNAQNESQSQSHPSAATTPSVTTRLSSAKEALEGLIANLMIQSKTNEVGVIVLRTLDTNHHLCPRPPKGKNQGEQLLINDGCLDDGGIDYGTSNSDNDVNSEPSYEHQDEHELVFPNITELSPIQRPSIHLLRKIREIDIARDRDGNQDNEDHGGHGDDHKHENLIPNRSGGFCDGIMLATDAMSKRTKGRKFERKIILLTDAEREVNMDFEALEGTIEELRNMECKITVVGLDFKNSAKFEEAATIDDPDVVTSSNIDGEGGHDVDHSDDDHDDEGTEVSTEMIIEEDNSTTTDDDDDDDDDDNDDDAGEGVITNANTDTSRETEQNRLGEVKSDNEKFLISLTKFTGGSVHAAMTIQQILNDTMGKRIPRSVLQKVEFVIAPGLSLPGRMSLSTRKANIPSLKRDAVTLDEDGNAMENALGETMTEEIMNSTTHYDQDNPDMEVELMHRANGYSYGSDLIPIGPIDMEGLKLRSTPKVTILSYTDVNAVPMSQWMGPTRVLSGDPTSRKARLAVSALSQALYRLKQSAICTYVGRTDADPVMGILIPLVEGKDTDDVPVDCGDVSATCTSADHNITKDDDAKAKKNNTKFSCKPRHLLFVQFPFIDDLQELNMHPLDDAVGDKSACDACDDLIDAFMLPPDVLKCTNIPNPAIRSFRKTIIQRAVDPNSKEIKGDRSSEGVNDLMSTPSEILEKGKDALSQFREKFSLHTIDSPSKRKRKKFWSDMK